MQWGAPISVFEWRQNFIKESTRDMHQRGTSIIHPNPTHLCKCLSCVNIVCLVLFG